MNMPLAIAFCTIDSASWLTCCGSDAEAITKSTGKLPPPGSGGGVRGITRTPGICDSFTADSNRNCCVVFLRLLQGLTTMPPKPPLVLVSWKMLACSGNDIYALYTSVVNKFV